MSEFDYPFDNSYITSEDQWEEWHTRVYGIPDGVKRGLYGEFEVTPATSGLVVNVAGGVAVVRGFYTRKDTEEPLTLEPPDTQNPRVDLVVLRRSKSGNGFTRVVITGDPAASPSAPTPVQDTDAWDLPLAEIYVAANAQSLDAGDITDRRVWTSGLDEHMDDTDNPHQVTPAQIGAATETDLQGHKNDHNNPHQVTYDQVGAAPASHTHALGDLSDVDTAGAAIGNGLIFDGNLWKPGAGGVKYYLARGLPDTGGSIGFLTASDMQNYYPPNTWSGYNPVEVMDGSTSTKLADGQAVLLKSAHPLYIDGIKAWYYCYGSGYGNRTVTFYTSLDGENWTQRASFSVAPDAIRELSATFARVQAQYIKMTTSTTGAEETFREASISLSASLTFAGIPVGSTVKLLDASGTVLASQTNDIWAGGTSVLFGQNPADVATIQITKPGDSNTVWLSFAVPNDIEGGALASGDALTLYAR